ncbi:MAG: cytochrome c-type biogenesis protein CcmH [Rhodanobacteraceae bacterium]|nr:MAG: cytochrome c-type biogenesis protein CcmH [Rhodanobacteraceae bacterium]
MKRLFAALLLACLLAPAAQALTVQQVTQATVPIDVLPFRNDAERARFRHLTGQLRCMVCQDESLLASNADFARQLRGQIFAMMQQGQSDKEIKAWLVARYSTFILYDPPLQASTIALWFGTPAILLIGGLVVAVLLRRRTRPADTITEDPGEDW